MSSLNVPRELYLAPYRRLADPGNAGDIKIGDMTPVHVDLVSAAAETRTLKLPSLAGAVISIGMKTDGGDIVLTVTGGYNEAGDTTFTFSDPGQFAIFESFDVGGTITWRKISDYLANNNNSLGSITFPSGSTVALAGNTNGDPGVGISGGTNTVFKSGVFREGGIATTRFLIDLTGLNGGGTAGDIIGTDGTGAAYLGQLTVAKNGTIYGGRVTCLETPAGSNVDVDVWSADEATGVEDTAISALTNEQQLINHGNWAAGDVAGMVLPPLANQYIYLTSGAATAGTFTAGQFLIEFFGTY